MRNGNFGTGKNASNAVERSLEGDARQSLLMVVARNAPVIAVSHPAKSATDAMNCSTASYTEWPEQYN